MFLLQTSRAGRLAAFADSQLSNHSDMTDNGGTGGGGGGGGENGGPVAEIVFTRLVVVEVLGREREREKKRGKGKKKDVGPGRQWDGVHNFKKFRKV